VVIGGVREIFGSGTLFANAHLLLGPAFAFLEITIVPEYKGFLLMILPPGGFMVVGLLLAAKRVLDQRRAAREVGLAAEAAAS
jgi:electron transport complex protein RnfE